VTLEFINKVKANIASKTKFDEPEYTLGDVKNKINLLQSEANAILSQPPPAPKVEEKEEEKTEAPKEGEAAPADKADAEMTETAAEEKPAENKD